MGPAADERVPPDLHGKLYELFGFPDASGEAAAAAGATQRTFAAPKLACFLLS